MSRNGPNLYELLKKASAKPPAAEPVRKIEPAPDPDEAPTTVKTLTPPPVKVGEVPPPEPAPRAFVAPPLKPACAPASAKSKLAGLGERVLHVTYNTAAFAGLVVLGLVFLGYAIGVRAGRASSASAQAAPARQVEPAAPQTPVVYTIRLMEWPGRTASERLKAQEDAAKIKRNLSGKRLNDAEVKVTGDKVLLNYGKFEDLGSEAAKKTLANLKDYRLQSNQPPAFKQADFVQAD